MVLPEQGPPIPSPPRAHAWSEPLHEELSPTPLTHRSEVSLCSDTGSASSRVASKLRETVNDWGFTDPNVARTFAARRKKMAKAARDSERRKQEKDPAKRLEKFRHQQGKSNIS